MQPFSVLMSVYKNDTPPFFARAIDSVLNQTIPPAEIVLVRDGEVTEELQKTINAYLGKYSVLINYIPLETNQGLGNALRIGVENAKYELIARMDSDDVSVNNRFELQLSAFEKYPETDIVGGQITEFIESEDNIVSHRIVPKRHDAIARYCKSRCPLNHMTVMFKKSAVLSAGNYFPLHFAEDYLLWCKMLSGGSRFANLEETLVNVRVGSEMYRRRGGWKYFRSLRMVEQYKLSVGLIGYTLYTKHLLMRFVQCVLLPNRLRGWLYKKIARKQYMET